MFWVEAFEAAGTKDESPVVNLPRVRRTGIPPGHAGVFDLKQGEVSEVITDEGGHYIYKMNSKIEMSLDQARSEIEASLPDTIKLAGWQLLLLIEMQSGDVLTL